MALSAGTRLGPYEILEPLGAGGMGEVYRARDTRLGRDVAIKVLPAERLSDPSRRARFEQEARAASQLNHPHIVTIFSVEEADDALGFALSTLCFEGPEEDLQLTANTQPALLATSIAVYRAVREAGHEAQVMAGHSLGEFSAASAVGAITCVSTRTMSTKPAALEPTERKAVTGVGAPW